MTVTLRTAQRQRRARHSSQGRRTPGAFLWTRVVQACAWRIRRAGCSRTFVKLWA
jgi:hypothetical protein